MLRVTVKRSLWGRGKQTYESKLLNSESGKMCCLGFACKTAKVPVSKYTDVGTPSGFTVIKTRLPRSLQKLMDDSGNDSYVCNKLMEHNDKHRHHARERTIKCWGKKAGISFRFVD
jgi:hypothetical protein